MTTLIHAEELTKRFDGLVAVNQVNLRLEEGEVLGIIGPNGSGKTTLFNLLSGYFPPSEGAIFFAGKNVTEIPAYQRVKMGMARTFQLVSVFDTLKVWENLVLSNLRTKRVKESPLGFFFQPRAKTPLCNAVKMLLISWDLRVRLKHSRMNYHMVIRECLKSQLAYLSIRGFSFWMNLWRGLSDHEIGNVLEMINRVKESFSLVVIEHKISKIMDLVQKLIVMNEGKIISEGSAENCLGDPKVRECYWGKEE